LRLKLLLIAFIAIYLDASIHMGCKKESIAIMTMLSEKYERVINVT